MKVRRLGRALRAPGRVGVGPEQKRRGGFRRGDATERERRDRERERERRGEFPRGEGRTGQGRAGDLGGKERIAS